MRFMFLNLVIYEQPIAFSCMNYRSHQDEKQNRRWIHLAVRKKNHLYEWGNKRKMNKTLSLYIYWKEMKWHLLNVTCISKGKHCYKLYSIKEKRPTWTVFLNYVNQDEKNMIFSCLKIVVVSCFKEVRNYLR